MAPFQRQGRRREAGKAGRGSVSQFRAVLGPLLREMSMEGRERLWRLLGMGWGCPGGSPSVEQLRAARVRSGRGEPGSRLVCREMRLSGLGVGAGGGAGPRGGQAGRGRSQHGREAAPWAGARRPGLQSVGSRLLAPLSLSSGSLVAADKGLHHPPLPARGLQRLPSQEVWRPGRSVGLLLSSGLGICAACVSCGGGGRPMDLGRGFGGEVEDDDGDESSGSDDLLFRS